MLCCATLYVPYKWKKIHIHVQSSAEKAGILYVMLYSHVNVCYVWTVPKIQKQHMRGHAKSVRGIQYVSMRLITISSNIAIKEVQTKHVLKL